MIASISNSDIHLLRVFIAVVEAGGYSKAQTLLNLTHSTISTQIINLETRLGMRLCRRDRVGFAVTDHGEKIYRFAKELVRSCEEFVGDLQRIKHEVSGELRIATADSLISHPNFSFDDVLASLRDNMP